MSTNIDRKQLAQLIREIIREDPSIVLEALKEARNQSAEELKISEEDRRVADKIFAEHKEVLDALA